jgi:hypothetical protein
MAAGTARGSTKQTSRKKVESINWPVDEDGVPMAQISFTASELIPTGNYANVTVGPATITKFVKDGDSEHLSRELNELAETIEAECIAEQREIVLKSLQADVSAQSK